MILGIVALPVAVSTSVLAAPPSCGGVTTAVLSCPSGVQTKTGTSNAIIDLLSVGLQILTVGVGIVAVGGLIYGGILYASAASSPDKVKKAVDVIKNVIVGLVAYLFMYVFLNFLIPGGVL